MDQKNVFNRDFLTVTSYFSINNFNSYLLIELEKYSLRLINLLETYVLLPQVKKTQIPSSKVTQTHLFNVINYSRWLDYWWFLRFLFRVQLHWGRQLNRSEITLKLFQLKQQHHLRFWSIKIYPKKNPKSCLLNLQQVPTQDKKISLSDHRLLWKPTLRPTSNVLESNLKIQNWKIWSRCISKTVKIKHLIRWIITKRQKNQRAWK